MNRPLITTGRLASRLSEAEQAQVVANLQPYLPTKTDWQHPSLEVELGMGNGLAILERAKANPSTLFVGCEIYLNGLQTCLSSLRAAGEAISNVRLTNADARDLLASVPAGSLSRILIPFPDPWPKAKHHKRRLVQPALLDACAHALKPGGELWVITDWPSYAFHSIATLFPHKDFILKDCEGEAKDCKPSARLEDQLGPHHLAEAPAWWIPTKYQQKAATAGRVPWFILARKRA